MHVSSFPSNCLAKWTVLIALAFLTIPLSGQIENHLILKKRGYINKVHFFTGDPITFIREGNTYAEEFYLDGIGADFLIVSGQMVPINKITYLIRRRTGFNFKGSGKALMIAAPGYLVIGGINALFQGISPVPTPSNLIVAGVLLTTGAIFPAFQVRKYPIGKKFTLKIVQSDPAWNKKQKTNDK